MKNGFSFVLARGAAILALASSMAAFGPQPASAEDSWWNAPADLSNLYSFAAQFTGETRTIIDRDQSHQITREITIPPYGSFKGAKITAYYPDTGKVRLKAESDFFQTMATYLRKEDGTRDCVLSVSYYGSTLVKCYDKTGSQLVLEQYWIRTDKVQNGISKPVYELFHTTEFDATGKPSRTFVFDIGSSALSQLEAYHVIINGVEYGEVDSLYRHDDHTLEVELRWLKAADHRYDERQEHAPGEKIAPPVVPANLREKPAYLGLDYLPIPRIPPPWY